MNIWAISGHKVKVTEETIQNGRSYDQENIIKYLEPYKEYEVDFTDVHGSSTDVYLKGFPDIYFNSVNFIDVNIQPEESNKEHKDWKRYNSNRRENERTISATTKIC
jgi:hypothetical protein